MGVFILALVSRHRFRTKIYIFLTTIVLQVCLIITTHALRVLKSIRNDTFVAPKANFERLQCTDKGIMCIDMC